MDFVSNLFKKSKNKSATSDNQDQICNISKTHVSLMDQEKKNNTVLDSSSKSGAETHLGGVDNQENKHPTFPLLENFDTTIQKDNDVKLFDSISDDFQSLDALVLNNIDDSLDKDTSAEVANKEHDELSVSDITTVPHATSNIFSVARDEKPVQESDEFKSVISVSDPSFSKVEELFKFSEKIISNTKEETSFLKSEDLLNPLDTVISDIKDETFQKSEDLLEHLDTVIEDIKNETSIPKSEELLKPVETTTSDIKDETLHPESEELLKPLQTASDIKNETFAKNEELVKPFNTVTSDIKIETSFLESESETSFLKRKELQQSLEKLTSDTDDQNVCSKNEYLLIPLEPLITDKKEENSFSKTEEVLKPVETVTNDKKEFPNSEKSLKSVETVISNKKEDNLFPKNEDSIETVITDKKEDNLFPKSEEPLKRLESSTSDVKLEDLFQSSGKLLESLETKHSDIKDDKPLSSSEKLLNILKIKNSDIKDEISPKSEEPLTILETVTSEQKVEKPLHKGEELLKSVENLTDNSLETGAQNIEICKSDDPSEKTEEPCVLLPEFPDEVSKILQELSANLEDSSTFEPPDITHEEILMSQVAPDQNSDLCESTSSSRLLESNIITSNEMGEVINQNDCFNKQSDVTNGAGDCKLLPMDNKKSLDGKMQIGELTERLAAAEAECEKYKIQVNDLKKELKICRQKSLALEQEVADRKRAENEFSVLLEEYKNKKSSASADSKDRSEEVKQLQATEVSLRTEIKDLKALIPKLEAGLKEAQKKEVKLADDLTNKTHSEMQISRVMEEYEKSISTFVAENEKLKKDRDTAQMHLANIELAFSDVHQKYERCKSIVQGYKDNEESFRQDITMNRETIAIQEQKYETLKAHAMAQLEKSNQELAAMKKQHETEMARLTAQLKRYEIKNISLMESLQQKSKECEQLSAVCDEFIGNV